MTDSRLVGTVPAHPAEFGGPEWTRRSPAPVSVRVTGTTLFSELGVAELPSMALYDAGFGWRFTFRMH